jgi:hypothetical protein
MCRACAYGSICRPSARSDVRARVVLRVITSAVCAARERRGAPRDLPCARDVLLVEKCVLRARQESYGVLSARRVS